jgi:hypothetical protein
MDRRMNNAPPSARMPAAGTQAPPFALVVSAWPPRKCWQVAIGWNG